MKPSLFLALLILSLMSKAMGEETPTENTEALAAAAEAEAEAADHPITLSLGFDTVTTYWFRGILQENQGFIAEPAGAVSMDVFDGAGFFSGLNLKSGAWASLHSGPTGSGGAGNDPDAWYELDWWGGIEAGFFDDAVLFGATTFLYTSPNDRFASVVELDLDLSLDDSTLWGNTSEILPGWKGLRPAAKLAFELDGQSDGGAQEGIYLEAKINPGIDLPVVPGLRLDIPVIAGFSIDDYFEGADGSDRSFGYIDVGFDLNAPLAFVPKELGAWGAHAGLHLLSLGDSNREKNNGDAFDTWFGAGVTIGF